MQIDFDEMTITLFENKGKERYVRLACGHLKLVDQLYEHGKTEVTGDVAIIIKNILNKMPFSNEDHSKLLEDKFYKRQDEILKMYLSHVAQRELLENK